MSGRGGRDVAIVGMACRFPGSPDLPSYWANILGSVDCTSDVPPDRWDPRVFFDPDSASNDRVACRRGGYLAQPIPFDPAADGIMPRAVEGGEPEQFLILDTARAALADAGLGSGVADGRRVEVVVGRGNYFNRGNLTRLQHGRIVAQTLAILGSLHPDWSEADREAVRQDLKRSLPPFEAATVPGQLTNATAGRAANRLGLEGASYVVDAASASSLVALDLAARSLREGRSDLALVGGVYLEADVDFPLVFGRLGALSRSGRSRPFARDADGMLSGEGVGVVVLKRRGDAEADGDRIYAVVRGVGIASDGRGRGLTAPSPKGHARAIRRAYRRSGVDPASVGLVEGHGLGLPAADRAELRALRATFPAVEPGRRVLGAVSSLIGHAMPAAGMAGLIKTALALHHRILPPSGHAEVPHPLLSGDGPFALNPRARPWVHGDESAPRRAGVNAFGFAGINAHAILEEHPGSDHRAAPGAMPAWDSEAILIDAPDRAGLAARVRALLEWLRSDPDATLKDLAFTINTKVVQPSLPAERDAGQAGMPAPPGTETRLERLVGQAFLPARNDPAQSKSPAPSEIGSRLGLVVTSLADLADRLATLLPKLDDPGCRSIRDARGSYFWERSASEPRPRVAFLFPGEGSQYPGMLADLCPHFPEVRALFDTSDRLAREGGAATWPSEHLFGEAATSGAADPALWSAGVAVNVVLSAQWALYRLLSRLKIRPDAVLGHSSGEFLALAASGVLEVDRDFEDRLGALGSIFGDLESSGLIPRARLAALATSRARVDAAIEPADGVAVAIDNCPHQVVVAGPPDGVEAVVSRMKARGVVVEDLPFDRAYHTAGFAPALGPIADFFGSMNPKAPTIPLYSCASAARMPDDPEAIRALAIAQWTRAVAFRETVEAMHADGLDVFVDVGARGNLAGFVEDTLRGKPTLAVAANLPRRSGLAQLNHLVAQLFAKGVDLDPTPLYARRRPVRLDLEARPAPRRAVPSLAVGFPTMRLSDGLVAKLKSAHPDRDGGRQDGEVDRGIHDSPLPASGRGPGGEGASMTEHRPATAATRPATTPHPGPLPAGGEREGERTDPDLDDVEATLLDFQRSMDAFLASEREVMGAYFAAPSPDDPGPEDFVFGPNGYHPAPSLAPVGPWAGELASIEPGRESVAFLTLAIEGDPVAEHHTLGGRRISAIHPEWRGLPVLPFSVMAEILAESAARLIPGSALTGLRDVRAHRWIRYEDEPVTLEVRARVEGPGAVRVAIHNRGPSRVMREPEAAVFEGVVDFGDRRPEPPEPPPFRLEGPTPCRFTADSIYAEQWLFHGPALRAVAAIGPIAIGGIEGTLRVLPLAPLLREGADPSGLLTDPIILDNFTHLLGGWGLDRLADDGDVIFPLGMGELAIFGEAPPEGSDVACRITIVERDRHRVRVDADIVRPDGRTWMAIRDWEDWRFRWPGRYRDGFRQPDRTFLGEPLELDRPGTVAAAVWLEPPADMGKPVWRDVLEHVQLGPDERVAYLAEPGPDFRRTHRLWGRIAAKEAARRLGVEDGPTYPADLLVVKDPAGRPVLRHRGGRGAMPSISIGHVDGVAVALASSDPKAKVGIDVEPIVMRERSFEQVAFTPGERDWLEGRPGDDRAEWSARLWCAKEATAKATGLGFVDGPSGVEVIAFDESGELGVCLRGGLAEACPELAGGMIRVVSARRGEFAWAWTLGERGGR